LIAFVVALVFFIFVQLFFIKSNNRHPLIDLLENPEDVVAMSVEQDRVHLVKRALLVGSELRDDIIRHTALLPKSSVE
jgi:hypothetical protein